MFFVGLVPRLDADFMLMARLPGNFDKEDIPSGNDERYTTVYIIVFNGGQ